MGKIIRGVLLIILVAMLSGCQSTPEDSVVVGKDAAAFEEKLKEELLKINNNVTDFVEHAEFLILSGKLKRFFNA